MFLSLCKENMNVVGHPTANSPHLCILFYRISMKSYAGMMDIKLKLPILGKTVPASKPVSLVAHFITINV